MNLGIIPARGGSKGLPRKNVLSFAGHPLIAHTVYAAGRSKLLNGFLVSTDDAETADAARAAGADVPFLRPAELATDEISVWPAVDHAVKFHERRSGAVVTEVVLLQPTSPLRSAEDIDNCIARFHELDADLCATAVAPHDSPYFNMVEPVAEDRRFVRPCMPPNADRRRQNAPSVYALNGAVYVVRRDLVPVLVSTFAVERFAVSPMPRSRSIDIDTADDFALAEWLKSRS